MAAVQEIDGEKLIANQTELAIAVHGLQRFVSHHILARLMPEEFQPWHKETHEVHPDQ